MIYFVPFLSTFLILIKSSSADCPLNISVIPQLVNEPSSGSINYLQTIIYEYSLEDFIYPITNVSGLTLRFESSTDKSASSECPILFAVRQSKEVLTWPLPQVMSPSKNGILSQELSYVAARTICIEPESFIHYQKIYLFISSCSQTDVNFDVNLSIRNDFLLGIDDNRTQFINPSSPLFYRFNFTDGDDNPVIITASSDNNLCTAMSIQEPNCPVLDQENNFRFDGYWLTWNYKTGIIIRKNQFPSGFFLVFIVLSDDKGCQQWNGLYQNEPSPRNELSGRSKSITFQISRSINTGDYMLPIFLPILFYLALVTIVFIIFWGFHPTRVIGNDLNSIIHLQPSPKFNSLTGRSLKMSRLLQMGGLNPKKERSKNFLWSIIIIAIFYCVPVFQLIVNYLKVLYRTGELDLCYYNYLCAHPLGALIDFNHFYSNIGYILLGVAYMGFVRVRQKSFIGYAIARNENDARWSWIKALFPQIKYQDKGILNRFELYYALGVSLVLLGVLSASYHICPNKSNFQFDTSFMYVICVLSIIKIYQNRFPINVSTNLTFIILGLVATAAVLGLLYDSLLVKIIFSIGLLLAVFLLTLYLYNLGYLSDKDGKLITDFPLVIEYTLRGWLAQLGSGEFFTKSYKADWIHEVSGVAIVMEAGPNRWLFPLLVNGLNIIMIVVKWTILNDYNFASIILFIFMANLFLYVTYYGVMKGIHGEIFVNRSWIQLLTYFGISIAIWGIACYYFMSTQSQWDVSPADSRDKNGACHVLEFYDNHDMWHFLSAGALFLSFMSFLTFDDGLIGRDRSTIPVF